MMTWQHWQNDLKEYVVGFMDCHGLDDIQLNVVLNTKTVSSSSWHIMLEFISKREPESKQEDILKMLCELLPKVSREWRYQIKASTIEHGSGRILLVFDKMSIFLGAIQSVLNMTTEGMMEERRSAVTVQLSTEQADASLTSYRRQLVCDVTGRLLAAAGHCVTAGGGDGPVLLVTGTGHRPPPAAADSRPDAAVARVVVEAVVNAGTGKKEVEVTAEMYLRWQQTRLVAAGDSRPRCGPQQAAPLSRAAVAHELLSVATSSRCRLAPGAEIISSAADRAVFALYNYARLEALMDKFEVETAAGAYPPLRPLPLSAHQLHRLEHPLEWQLAWSHLLPLPGELAGWAASALSTGRPALHQLCSRLSALTAAFSRYYSAVHLFTPTVVGGDAEQQHGTLHARLHLLRAVRHVFTLCFHVLGYEPAARM